MSDSLNPYASPQVDSSAPGAQWASQDSSELRRVGTGLGLVYTGICMILGGAILFGASMWGGAAAQSAALLLLGAVLFGLMIFIGYILTIIGPFFCLAVPKESGARGLIIASVVFMLLGIVLAIATRGSAQPANFGGGVNVGAGANPALGGNTSHGGNLGGIPSLIGAVLFMLFIRKLAIFIGRPDLSARAMTVLISSIVIGVLFFGVALMFIIGIAAAAVNAGAGGMAGMAGMLGIFMMVLLVAALIVFVMYANLLNSMRKALRP